MTRLEEFLSGSSLADLDAVGAVETVVAVHASSWTAPVGAAVTEAAGRANDGSGTRAAVLVGGALDGGSAEAARAWTRGGDPGLARVPLQFTRPLPAGEAVVGLLAAAGRLGAAVCVFLDADLGAPPTDAIAAFRGPLVEGRADFVSPAFSRAVSEGTLTTNLLAPLTGALYGTRLQQVAGGCAGLAGAWLARLLASDTREARWTPQGTTIWLATEALATGARVVEVHLGPKPPPPAAPRVDLATTLAHTVGPLFALMERHRAAWQDVQTCLDAPRLGGPPAVLPDGSPPATERMVGALRLGLKDLLPVWEQIMPEATLARLYPLGLLDAEEFRFPPALWARVVADFAVAYHERRLPRDHLLRALTPLYLGRVAAFLQETRARSPAEVPALLDSIARAFEAEKPDLTARWR